jgi:transposase
MYWRDSSQSCAASLGPAPTTTPSKHSPALGSASRDGAANAKPVLLTTRAQAIEFRTRAIAALHALVVSAPDTQRERLRSLSLGQLLHTCAALRGSSRLGAEVFATVMALRATARRALACEHEATELETQIDALVRRIAPALLDEVGIGPVVAAQLIVSWSHPGRVRSEAAFAKLAGVAPIEASSVTA